MRTNIDIDDELMSIALKLTGLKTKKETVELALKTLISLKQQERIKKFRGKLKWEGNLDDMRFPNVIIATFCIEHGLPLLYADRDFEPFRRYLGLKSALTLK